MQQTTEDTVLHAFKIIIVMSVSWRKRAHSLRTQAIYLIECDFQMIIQY